MVKLFTIVTHLQFVNLSVLIFKIQFYETDDFNNFDGGNL
jgi:hypothetical protein